MQELPGSVVHTRGRRRTILDVVDHGSCRSVRLTSAGSSSDALTLLTPFDRLHPIPQSGVPRLSSRRRAVAACAAAIRQCRAAGELHGGLDADIRILSYQLEPALAVARGEAARVLLADEVGLGKTIQAGLVLAELRAAGALARALVLTPAGLRDQWARELRDRFGISARIMDAPALAALGRALPPWVNPWRLPGVSLASIDLLKRGELLPQVEAVTWDAVIVDEAHHLARGTDRHAAATLACSRAAVVVLITATPHNGDAASYEDLCALGALHGDRLPIRVFRRTRGDLGPQNVARRIRFVTVRPPAAEQVMHARLNLYTSRVWRDSHAASARLAMIVLRKRALSGPAPLVRSLARRLQALSAGALPESASQLALDFGDTLGGELVSEDLEPVAVLSAPGLADGASETALLSDVLEAARAAVPLDSKSAALARAVMRVREPVVVFTEYRDTLEDLRRRLDGRVPLVVLHGGMLPAERSHAVFAFTSGAARVLLATDAAAEGLNLHHRCRWIIHHEAPWSPTRVEQRNGRVDRFGQQKRVHVWHLVAAGTEEAGMLAELARKSAAAARAVGVEVAVARAVFEGLPLVESDEHSAAPVPSHAAAHEADRILMLRRIRKIDGDSTRPHLARVRRRGPFARLRSGVALAVFRARVLDGGGQRVASFIAGVESADPVGARDAALRYFDALARRSMAVHRTATRRRVERARAIERLLTELPVLPLQASLFDRRAIVDAEHRGAELARGREEAAERHAAGDRPTGRCRVSVDLVAIFNAR